MRKLLFLLIVGLLFWGCEQEEPSDLVNYSTIRGNTMGTTYSIVFKDADKQAEAIKTAQQHSMRLHMTPVA